MGELPRVVHRKEAAMREVPLRVVQAANNRTGKTHLSNRLMKKLVAQAAKRHRPIIRARPNRLSMVSSQSDHSHPSSKRLWRLLRRSTLRTLLYRCWVRTVFLHKGLASYEDFLRSSRSEKRIITRSSSSSSRARPSRSRMKKR